MDHYNTIFSQILKLVPRHQGQIIKGWGDQGQVPNHDYLCPRTITPTVLGCNSKYSPISRWLYAPVA